MSYRTLSQAHALLSLIPFTGSSILVNHPSVLLLGTPCPIVSINRCESDCFFTASLNLLIIIIANPGYIPKSRIAELNGNFLFNFLMNCQTVFQSGCTILRSYQECWASLVAQMVKNLPTMRETWDRSLGQEDPLEKEMATHSSIQTQKIPWTEEPGGLQSMGLQRVRHN